MAKKFKDVAKGTLGINYSKNRPEQPDFTGRVDFDGETANLSVWEKRAGDTGRPFYSFVISQEVDEEGNPVKKQRPRLEQAAERRNDLEDDIPF